MSSNLPLEVCIDTANTGLDAIKRAPIVEHDTGIRCIRIQDISQEKDFENWGFTEVTPANFKKFQLKKDDILIARTGGSIGVNRFISEDLQAVYNNGLIRIRVDTEKYFPKFVFYLLRTESFKQHINAIAFSTAAQPNMKIRDFLRFEFLDLPLAAQIQIADNLSDIDDKIELNRQTNQTLEYIAQAIFKSWFVDFEPTRAKIAAKQTGQDPERAAMVAISGKSLEEIDQLSPEQQEQLKTTAALFPDALVDSELGEIPEGWSVGMLDDLCSLNNASWTKKTAPEEVWYVDLANTKNGVIEEIQYFSWVEAPSRARRILNKGDTLIGTVRPGNRSFAIIGEMDRPLTASTGFAVLTPLEDEFIEFIFVAATSDENIDRLAHLADGGAYPAVRPDVVTSMELKIPTGDVMKAFSDFTKALFDKRDRNLISQSTFENLREALLPKLVSGELEVNEVA